MGWWQILIYGVFATTFLRAYHASKATDFWPWPAFLILCAFVLQEYDARVLGNELNIVFYRICDAFIFAFLWRERGQKAIAAILAIYLTMWIAYTLSDKDAMWWYLYWGTLAQIVLAGPWPEFARIGGKIQHGSFRKLPDAV